MKLRNALYIALCFILSVTTMGADIAPKPQHKAMHWIVTSDGESLGGCTANAISEHVLITAEHCNMDTANSGRIWIDTDKRDIVAGAASFKVTEKYFDNEDHMLVVIPDAEFTDIIPYDFRPALIGEHVYFWGNPAGVRDVYREGVFVGRIPAALVNPERSDVELYQIPTVGGDSGSTVFGEDGRAVAIVTYGIFNGMFMGAYPVEFTQDQIDAAMGIHGASCSVRANAAKDEDGNAVSRFECQP